MMSDTNEQAISIAQDMIERSLKKAVFDTKNEEKVYNGIYEKSQEEDNIKKMVDWHVVNNIAKIITEIFDFWHVIPDKKQASPLHIARWWHKKVPTSDGKPINMSWILAQIHREIVKNKNKGIVEETVNEIDGKDKEKKDIKKEEKKKKGPGEIRKEGIISRDHFKDSLRPDLDDDIIDTIIEMGNKIRDKVEDLGNDRYDEIWKVVSRFVLEGGGKEMISEWRGKSYDNIISSMFYVAMRHLYDKDPEVKVTKKELYSAVDVNPRSCFRSIDKIKDYGLTY